MDPTQTFFSYHGALTGLIHSQAFINYRRAEKLASLASLCSELLGVDRVSVWTVGLSADELRRELLYCRRRGGEQGVCSISRQQHPEYFEAMQSAAIVDAGSVGADRRTRSFLQLGYGGGEVAAMLGAPIFDGNRFSGAFCLEHGQPRDWSLADIAFVTAVADTVSLLNTHEAWLNSRKELDYVTHHDDFTGLLNQRSLRNRVNTLIEQSRGRQADPFALLWIDIDKLNSINHGMGMHIGNQVVSEVAARLRGMLLPGKELVARVGGDEFALVYRFPEDQGTMHGAVDTILDTINHPIMAGEQRIQVSASIGISFYPYDGDDTATLIRNSEAAMYQAKASGRRQAQYFNKDLSAGAKARFLLEGQLQAAIEQDRLTVVYQPIMAGDGRQVVGLEALVRWQHDSLGFMSPAEFLPLAYEAGLMAELDQRVLEQVCRDMERERLAGRALPPVAVNLSADSIMNPALADRIWTLLQRYRVDGGQLELEVIEDVIKGDSSTLRATLSELVGMGIKLSIDDFGTGYSSLLRLKSLPFSRLKIDRSFTRELPNDADDCAITLSILGLARGLGLQVIAEGVEQREQEAWLQQQGCDYLQGFRYARPMALDELRNWLDTRPA
ncbi:putative bifunctional diguanylate cyclase/phosphodiesterase [Zobellella taiwanensis]